MEIIDRDLGIGKLKSIIEKTTSKAVIVGITEDSPRAQFRRGSDQEFRPKTAALLLRAPVDNKKSEIKNRLIEIARKAIAKGVNPDDELQKLGEEIKADMGAQTDPPPQLRNAIIVKVENGS